MPAKPLKPCNQPGCGELMRGRAYCKEHTKHAEKQDRQARGSSWQRGYDTEWQHLRLVVLRLEPLCRHCKQIERIEPATLVDHIIPITSKADPNRLDLANLQPLCIACHAIKTQQDVDAGATRRDHR